MIPSGALLLTHIYCAVMCVLCYSVAERGPSGAGKARNLRVSAPASDYERRTELIIPSGITPDAHSLCDYELVWPTHIAGINTIKITSTLVK